MQSGADREVEGSICFIFFFCIQCHARIAVKVVSTFSRADVIVGSAFNDI